MCSNNSNNDNGSSRRGTRCFPSSSSSSYRWILCSKPYSCCVAAIVILIIMAALIVCTTLVPLETVLPGAVLSSLLPLIYPPYLVYAPKQMFLYDQVLARNNRSYPVCALLPDLYAGLRSHERVPGFRAALAAGEVYCGKVRQVLAKKRLWGADCLPEILPAKQRVLAKIEQLCRMQQQAVEAVQRSPNKSLPLVMTTTAVSPAQSQSQVVLPLLRVPVRSVSRGLVLTGQERHLRAIYRALTLLRRLNCSLPAEVFVDPDLLPVCSLRLARQLRGVRCRALPGRTVGYVAKLHALLLTSFREVLFVGAHVLFTRSPEEVLDSPAFRERGAVLWPDWWGEACRREPGAPRYGESAWAVHVLGRAEVGGLRWREERVFAQEADTGVVAVDTTRHAAVLSLAVALKDDTRFFANLFHGDKDIVRWSFLLMRAPFYFVPQLPGTAFLGDTPNSIAHYFDKEGHGQEEGSESAAPLFFNQMRVRSGEGFRLVLRLRPELRRLPSVCSYGRHSGKFTEDHVTDSSSNSSGISYDGEAFAALVDALYRTVDERWAHILHSTGHN